MQLAKTMSGMKYIVKEKNQLNKTEYEQEIKVNYNKGQLLKNKP